MQLISLRDKINGLADAVGGLRALSRMTGIDVGYLSRMAAGHADNPSDDVLERLNLRRVSLYENVGGTLGPKRK